MTPTATVLRISRSETSERGVHGERFDAHRLGRLHFDNAGLSRLHKLGVVFELLTVTLVNKHKELVESTGDVSSVAIQDWRVTSHDLVGVVKDDNLSIEGNGRQRRISLAVTTDLTTLDILDRDVL